VDTTVQVIKEKGGHSRPETRTPVSGEGGHQCPTIPMREPIEETIERKSLVIINQAVSDFEDWYRHYPRKVGKLNAEKAYGAIIKKQKATREELIAGVMRYAAERATEDPKYTKHPATWLNGGCWADEPKPTAFATPTRADSAIAGMRRFLEEPSQ
jgi:hypothetical protein